MATEQLHDMGGNMVTLQSGPKEPLSNLTFTNKNFSTCKSKVNRGSNKNTNDNYSNVASNILQKQFKK